MREPNWDMRMRYLTTEHGKFDFTDAMRGISCPVLYIAGQHDPVHPVSCAQSTANEIPDAFCEFHVVNAGTPVYIDAENDVMNLNRNFVNRMIQHRH